MKVLSIRAWLTVVLSLIMILLVLVIGGAILMLQKTPLPTYDENRAFQALFVNPLNWEQASWQQEIEFKLSERAMFALIRNETGQEIYRSPTMADFSSQPKQVIALTNGIRLLGTVSLYERSLGISQTQLYLLGGLATIVASFLLLAWVVSQAVLKPLRAVASTAREVGDGRLEFKLPFSEVKEVAQVIEAFEGMGVALRSSMQRQAELEQERRFFIMAIAHDLRTPLFSLRGYLQGLEKGLATTPQKTKRYIQVCQNEADALEHLIEDLFAFAQLEYAEQLVQGETFDLAGLIRQIVEGLSPQAESKHIALVLESPAETCIVEGDWHLLRRAFGNLVDNALRYTSPGGKVEISWRQEVEQIAFTISDNGPGIAPQDLPHLFEPLYRGELSRNRQTGGAGLGLTISQRILRIHRGDLKAANRPEGGAIFSGSLRRSTSTNTQAEDFSTFALKN